jgi:dTDP-D-glucose 4,6-dehydratase
MDTLTSKKEETTFICDKCHYKCSKKYNLDRHFLTDKHKRIHFGFILDTKKEENEQKEENYNYVCCCGNKYKYSQGLSKHKIKCKQNNEYFTISGSGKPLRQFIYSIDLALAIMLVLEDYKEMSSIIIAPDETSEVSISYVAKLIAKEFDYEHMIKFDESKSDGQYKKTVSNNKFKELFNNFYFTEIEEGIKSTIKWFLLKYPNIRK